MMQRNLFLTTAFLGLLGVVIGAFGAHGLKPLLNEYQQAIFDKGVYYQFIHVLAALVALVLARLFDKPKFSISALLFLIGILFFSGSLYLLAVKDILAIPVSFIGPLTPLGGVFFIVGWTWMIFQGASSFEN